MRLLAVSSMVERSELGPLGVKLASSMAAGTAAPAVESRVGCCAICARVLVNVASYSRVLCDRALGSLLSGRVLRAPSWGGGRKKA